jgi:hypothetical protein
MIKQVKLELKSRVRGCFGIVWEILNERAECCAKNFCIIDKIYEK